MFYNERCPPRLGSQLRPIMDPQNKGERVSWEGHLCLFIKDTVGSCEGPVGTNLGRGGEFRGPTRIALQVESMGAWLPTNRRAIQGKEFSLERWS